MPNSPDERPADQPEYKDKTAGARVPEEIFDAANAKAKKKGRSLSSVIRAFLILWSQDEFPDPPELPESDKVAPRRKKK